MPPLPFASKVVKMVATITGEADAAENIFHFLYSTGPTTTSSLEAFDTSVHTALYGMYQAQMTTEKMLTTVQYTDLSSDVGATYIAEYGIAGTLGDDVFSAQAAVLVSWLVNRRWRGGHPRTYFPNGGYGALSAGTTNMWDTAFLNNQAATCETYLTKVSEYADSTMGACNPVNLSYWNAKALRPVPITDLIVGLYARPRICTQRRRLGKVGA